MITLYDCDMIIVLYQVHQLILYLLRSVCYFFSFDLLEMVRVLLFNKKCFLCMLVNWFYTMSSSLIDSFLALICMFFLISKIVAGMLVSIFTRRDSFVWLWSDYYFISSLLIDSLLALIWTLFRIIWFIVAGVLLAVLQEKNYFVGLWHDY